jgi:hypothetical protein
VYHPNIDLEGNICLNILREDWKPVLSISSVVYGLQFLFLVRGGGRREGRRQRGQRVRRRDGPGLAPAPPAPGRSALSLSPAP